MLASIFKLWGASFLKNAFRRLDYLTLKDCNSLVDYITKFYALINKLCSFLSKFKIDDNFFIYKFLSNLGPNHASYIKRYEQNHDIFHADGKAKYSLSLTI